MDDIMKAVSTLVGEVHRLNAGKLTLTGKDKSDKPCFMVVAVVEPELITQIQGLIDSFDKESDNLTQQGEQQLKTNG